MVAIIQIDEPEILSPALFCKIEGSQFISPKYPATCTIAIMVRRIVVKALPSVKRSRIPDFLVTDSFFTAFHASDSGSFQRIKTARKIGRAPNINKPLQPNVGIINAAPMAAMILPSCPAIVTNEVILPLLPSAKESAMMDIITPYSPPPPTPTKKRST